MDLRWLSKRGGWRNGGRKHDQGNPTQARFEVRNGAGETRLFDEFVQIIEDGHHGDPNAELEGLHEIRTRDGLHVNVIGDGRYQVLPTMEEWVESTT